MMELKNLNPKTAEDWAIVAMYDSVEIDGEDTVYEVNPTDCGVDEVEYDMD